MAFHFMRWPYQKASQPYENVAIDDVYSVEGDVGATQTQAVDNGNFIAAA